MLEAAKAGLRKQRWLYKQMGRDFVQYPMRVGEPERSGRYSRRRDYDDGSAVDTRPSTTTRVPTTNNNLGGNDDADDSLSDFSDRTTILIASAVLK